MKKNELDKMNHITHSLSNRMSVVNHLLKFYAKHLPNNRLTDIGIENAEQIIEELKEMKTVLNNLNQGQKKAKENLISLSDWKDEFLMTKEELLEMSVFSIDIQSNDLPEQNISVAPSEIKDEIGLYFEEVAMTGATEMGINVMATDKVLKLSFSDNGDGSIDAKSENLLKLKNNLISKDINTQVRSIPSVGSNMTLSIKLAS